MLKLQAIPGDFIICKKVGESDYLFRLALPIEKLYSMVEAEAFVEKVWDLDSEFEVEGIKENQIHGIRTLVLEDSKGNKIDTDTLRLIHRDLIEKKYPVNNNGNIIFNERIYFFKEVSLSGVIKHSTVVKCFQTNKDKEIDELKGQNKRLKRQIVEKQNKLEELEIAEVNDAIKIEEKVCVLERQINEKQNIIENKKVKVNNSNKEIEDLKKQIDKKNSDEKAKNLDKEAIAKIARTFK